MATIAPSQNFAPAADSQSLGAGLSGAHRDAYEALSALFDSYGLSSLAGRIYTYIQNGYSADTISLELQNTPEFKTRFAGDEIRRKAGLPVLNPADYLATEASYRQILSSAGLPAGFYDSPGDLANWIGGDVSPTEIKSRVDLATVATTQADKFTRDQLKAYYGVDDAHLTAYFLDQSKALPLLQKQEAAAQFGAEAARRGLLSDRQAMEDYVSQGFTQSQASQGFQQVADELPNLQALAQRFGTTFNQAEEESTVFGTNTGALAKKRGLASQERALFGSRAGGAAAGLGAGYRQT